MIVEPGRTHARVLFSDLLCVLGVIVCALPGFPLVAKYVHGIELLFFAIGIAICISLAMLWLRWRLLSPDQELRVLWLLSLWCFLTLLFAVLFPVANRHTLGVGSDRADALRISASALVHGHYPYYSTTYLGNAITPLPGAILLSVPFLFLSNVSLQNPFWLALFLWFGCWFFRSRSTALVYVLILLCASAANLDDFVVGGDFLVNSMYACIALASVLATHQHNARLWLQIAAEIFLGLAIDSRPVYVVILPLLFAYLWQQKERRAAVRALFISGFVAAGLSIPFYLYDPAHFAPLHIEDKLDFIPANFHATIVLPALGLLASCLGFFIHLSRRRLYLMIGISLFCMMGLSGIIAWLRAPFTLFSWYGGLPLLGTPAVFFSLWILSVYEETGYALRSRRHDSSNNVTALP